uniref:Transmembrane protein n=1 Tax=Heterorhabditis bacteriophora TaxID=37862 RepID=A0A1I7X6Y4_HETBA
MEASDLMEIGHVTFDQNLKKKMTRPRSKHAFGPFYQIVAYQFGSFRIMVRFSLILCSLFLPTKYHFRFEVDCADFAAVKCPPVTVEQSETLPEKKKAPENEKIESRMPTLIHSIPNNNLFYYVFKVSSFLIATFFSPCLCKWMMVVRRALDIYGYVTINTSTLLHRFKVVEYGQLPHDLPLQLLTTYPQGAGFPFFTWAQLFFTNANQGIVGWFKGNGDFGKPSFYTQQDISKMMKPLPYVTLSKDYIKVPGDINGSYFVIKPNKIFTEHG